MWWLVLIVTVRNIVLCFTVIPDSGIAKNDTWLKQRDLKCEYCVWAEHFHPLFLTIKEMWLIRKNQICQQQVPYYHGNCENNLMTDSHDWLIVLLVTAETEWDLELYLKYSVWNKHHTHTCTHTHTWMLMLQLWNDYF